MNLIKVISVFTYLNTEMINRHLISSVGGTKSEFQLFQSTVNKVHGPQNFNAGVLFRTFMDNFMSRMAAWAATWVNGRIDDLLDTWQQVVSAAAPGSAANTRALNYVAQLRRLKETVRQDVVFDSSTFIYM